MGLQPADLNSFGKCSIVPIEKKTTDSEVAVGNDEADNGNRVKDDPGCCAN
jgi:hypothetical protein